MLRFRQIRSLQKFVAVHPSIHNHFNQEHHLCSRANFKLNCNHPLANVSRNWFFWTLPMVLRGRLSTK
jgi:hypothetical protein